MFPPEACVDIFQYDSSAERCGAAVINAPFPEEQ